MNESMVKHHDNTSTTSASSFPWHSVAKRKRLKVGLSGKVVAESISIGWLVESRLTVCRQLDVGWGNANEAIVFDEVHLGFIGRIKELHCLSSTKQTIEIDGKHKGEIDNVTFHSMDELVQMALVELNMVAKLDNICTTSTSASSFPWHSVDERKTIPKKELVLFSGPRAATTSKVVAQIVSREAGILVYADLAVCRQLNLSSGRVKEAIVFEKLRVGRTGIVNELHCLSSTKQTITKNDRGRIENVTFHSMDELVQMALEKLDMDSLRHHQDHRPLPPAPPLRQQEGRVLWTFLCCSLEA